MAVLAYLYLVENTKNLKDLIVIHLFGNSPTLGGVRFFFILQHMLKYRKIQG